MTLAEILTKSLHKYLQMKPDAFSEGADIKQMSEWLGEALAREGWMRIGPSIERTTLHPLSLDHKFIGAQVGPGTDDILPKGSRLAIIQKGDETHPIASSLRAPDPKGMEDKQ